MAKKRKPKKPYLLILLLFMILPTTMAKDSLDFIRGDSRHHIGTSYILGHLMNKVFEFDWLTSQIAILGIGLLKENYDVSQGGDFDSQDILANQIGCGLYYVIEF